MTPTNTITDGTSLLLLGGTPVFFNFTTKAAVDYFKQPKGVGDPTAPSDPASLKLNKKL
jgi:hypothetical protein